MKPTKKFTLTTVLALITYLIMVLTNVLANVLPINNLNTGQVSDSYTNLFAPIGFTFIIWGLIYVLLLVYSLYQLLNFRNFNQAKKTLISKINVYFIISSIANTLWIFAWHYQKISYSLILMIIILICLILINLLLKNSLLNIKQQLLIKLPFTIYFGWITVATIANVTTFLVASNWNQWGISAEIWTLVILVIGALIGFVGILYYHSFGYGLVVIWAYIGIVSKHLSTDYFNNQYPNIVISCYVLIFVLFFAEFLLVDYYLKKARIAKKNND